MFTKTKRVNTKVTSEHHSAVDLDKLSEGKHLPFDVFTKDMGLTKPLFEKGMLFTSTTKSVLKAKGISEVFIRQKNIDDNDTYFAATKDEKSSFYDDPVLFNKYSFYKDQHHQIDRAFLIPGARIYFSLYVLHKLNFSPVVEVTIENPVRITEDMLSVPGDLVIKKSDIPLYYQYLNFLTTSKNISSEKRYKAKLAAIKERTKIIIRDFIDSPAALKQIKGIGTKERAKILVRNILNDPKSGEKMLELIGSINEMVDSISENRDAVYGLLSLKGCDYYTYTHSVNVAALSVSLGIALGLKRDQVANLGLGAILHDIGKSVIAPEILHKQGKLNEAEYKILRNHVLEGEKILLTHKTFPEESFPAVLQHHEKLSGRGYPRQLSGNQIKTFGRIVGIADCFDALTTHRPFKPALAPYLALSVIAKETGNYDHEFLRVFIKTLGEIE
jgi:HD-GYP domain-containing protein (c-di-GMP phosphodiesterase class II)